MITRFFSTKNAVILLSILLVILFIFLGRDFLKSSSSFSVRFPQKPVQNLQIRSIDTVKYSRDIAREKEEDQSFDAVISRQVADIAGTGATHIAIGAPYDAEFIPFLSRWVKEARKHNLKVWFRGNFSGWEGWFGYPKINRETHTRLTGEFILNNADLFEDGDIFTPCPECENGGSGDPRRTGDVAGFRKFLIDEYTVAKNAFSKINKKVLAGYFSMNGDVVRLVMDQPTTKALGGIVVIDHYVKDVDTLIKDIRNYAQATGGKVVLGEFGVPIPDIHGNMSEDEQNEWLKDAFEKFKQTPELIGVNYWVSVGGSTQLWDGNKPKKAVDVLRQFYTVKR